MASVPHEQALEGGNMTTGVVRIGATVRRPLQAQSATIHRLLAHVKAKGVSWVPGVLGIDDAGREILDFIEGEVVHDRPDWLWSPTILADVARALRQWHDATASFARGPDDVWWWQEGKQPAEVICHVDFAPYNHVFLEGSFVGAIDFDLCYPGPRLWDLAYTAYRYVPLTPAVADDVADGEGADRSPFGHAEQVERARLFLEAYGPGPGDESETSTYSVEQLIAAIPERLIAMADWCDVQESGERRRDGIMYRAHAQWAAAGGPLAAGDGLSGDGV